MQNFSNELEALQAEVVHYHKLEVMLQSLYTECGRLGAEEREYAKIREKEQRDVDALERVSISSILSAIRGNKDEKLSREQKEAHAAYLKHEAAVHRLRQCEEEIRRTKDEIARLSGCEERFRAAVERRLSQLKRSGGAAAQKAYDLEEKISYLTAQKRELDEAVSAGEKASYQIDFIESSLSSAEGWGVFDMLGGGMLSAMAKHSHLDEAQAQVEQLQYLLSRFRTELADIRISADLGIQIDGFLRFADYFFDGLFMDWMVLDKINKSQEQVASTKSEVYAVLQNLHQLGGELEREILSLRKQLEALAMNG